MSFRFVCSYTSLIFTKQLIIEYVGGSSSFSIPESTWLQLVAKQVGVGRGKFLLTYWEKRGKEKCENGAEKKENGKKEGGKLKMEEGKVRMRRGPFLFFFFFFFFCFSLFKTTQICFGSTKMGIFNQGKAFY